MQKRNEMSNENCIPHHLRNKNAPLIDYNNSAR